MKQRSKYSKLYAILSVLVLLLLFAVNSAFAYFSAKKEVNKQGNMGTMHVVWNGSKNGRLTNATNNTYIVSPKENSIARGQTVAFANDEVIGFEVVEGTPAYVRFWLTAVVGGNDYSEYFTLDFVEADSDIVTIATGLDNDNTTDVVENVTMYYYNYSIREGSIPRMISGVTMAEDAPMGLLGQNGLTITLYFEAVQASNSAYLAVFDDWRGYSADWE